MVMESYDVSQFLLKHPLLGEMSEQSREILLNHTQIAFGRAKEKIEFEKDKVPGLLILRSGSVEIRDKSGELRDLCSIDGLGLIPAADLRVQEEAGFDLIPKEDSLYYELDKQIFKDICAQEKRLQEFCETWRRRFQPATEGQATESGAKAEDAQSLLPSWGLNKTGLQNYGSLGDYMRSPIISVPSGTSITEAAKIMSEKRISALLVSDEGTLKGIVTDKDLRSRVLAAELSPKKKVEVIMTPDPVSISAAAKLHEAQMMMMARDIRHLVVTKDNQPAGMISANDLFKAGNLEPLPLMSRMKKAETIEGLIKASKLLPELVAKLIERNTRPSEIGQIITAFTDGMTRRLITLAKNEVGQPPCEFTWLAFGSQARQEQVLGSDQDNALILSEDYKPEMDTYFLKFSQYVNDGLHHCGIVHCPGDIMACNPKWRMTLSQWKAHFDKWIDQPEPLALMHASIFFDMRHVSGRADLQKDLQIHVLEKAQKNTIFLAFMSGNAIQHRPPLGFFKNFVLDHNGEHANELDMKKRGTIPIVDIARNYSLANGISEVNTVARLNAIKDGRAMSAGMIDSLIDAHEFIARIRLEAQAEEFRQGERADNFINPKTLSPLQRHQLKEAFQWVKDAQNSMQNRFGGRVQ